MAAHRSSNNSGNSSKPNFHVTQPQSQPPQSIPQQPPQQQQIRFQAPPVTTFPPIRPQQQPVFNFQQTVNSQPPFNPFPTIPPSFDTGAGQYFPPQAFDNISLMTAAAAANFSPFAASAFPLPPPAIQAALLTQHNPMTSMFANNAQAVQAMIAPFMQTTTAPHHHMNHASHHPLIFYAPSDHRIRTPPLPRVVERLKIIDPNTMQEVDLEAVVRSRRESLNSTAKNTPTEQPAARAAAAAKPPPIPPKKPSVSQATQTPPESPPKTQVTVATQTPSPPAPVTKATQTPPTTPPKTTSTSTQPDLNDDNDDNDDDQIVIVNNEFLASLTAEPDFEEDLESNGNETTEWFPAAFTADQDGIFEVTSESNNEDSSNLAGSGGGDTTVVEENSAVEETPAEQPQEPAQTESSQYPRDFILKCYQNAETRAKPNFLFEGSVAILATVSGNLTDVLLRTREPGRRAESSRLPKTRSYHMNRQGSHRFYAHPPEVQLHRTNNPYKVVDQSELSATQQLEKKFRELLNKISPENEKIVTEEILKLKFQGPDDMKAPLEIIFDKAVYEPQYRSIYARIAQYLCSRVSFQVTEPPAEEGGEPKTTIYRFKTALMKKVENAFGAKFTDEPELLEWLEKKSKAQTETESNHLQSCYNEAYSMKKRKYIGLMEFIGHLFLIRVLNERIITNCFERLMSVQEGETTIGEWQIESVIRLLMVIGQMLDQNPKKETLMPRFMQKVTECMGQLEDPRRVKWMFDDLKQKRASKWIDTESSTSAPINNNANHHHHHQHQQHNQQHYQHPHHTKSARPRGSELQFDKRAEGFGRSSARQDPNVIFKQKMGQVDAVGEKVIRDYLRNKDEDTGSKGLDRFVKTVPLPELQSKLWAALVSKGYDIACDKAEADVVNWAKLLMKLITDKAMPANALVSGIHEFWQAADEIVLDVPQVYDLVGASIAQFINGPVDIEEVFRPIADTDGCIQAVGKMIKSSKEPCFQLANNILKNEERVAKCKKIYGL